MRAKQVASMLRIAVPMLFSLVGVSLLATMIVLAMPPLVLGTKLPREKGVLKFLMYFLCIGVGYILIQVALIQKFVLFLGHPTYALTVIIFSMLVSSGVGSFLSGKYIGNDDNKLMRALALVAVLVAMLAFSASHITTALVGLPLIKLTEMLANEGLDVLTWQAPPST